MHERLLNVQPSLPPTAAEHSLAPLSVVPRSTAGGSKAVGLVMPPRSSKAVELVMEEVRHAALVARQQQGGGQGQSIEQ